MKLAEALGLRKHLEAKVEQLKPLKVNGDNGVYEQKIERRNINENIDEIVAQVPKVELSSITAEYDRYSKALRQLDTAIQQTNWNADLIGDVSLDGINV